MRDLVFVKFNSKLRNKKQNKDRDPIEKDVEDAQADNDNEFIMGAVYVPSEHAEPETQHGASHGQESTSQAQGRKRKRPAVAKKKRKKSIHSLLNSIEEDPMLCSSSSSESEDDQAQDESNYASADSD